MRYTPFTRSSKYRANIKQAWWNPAFGSNVGLGLAHSWSHAYRPSNYNPTALLISMLITIARQASWLNASKHRADLKQLARVFWIHLFDVCSMFTRSCKRGRPITYNKRQTTTTDTSYQRLDLNGRSKMTWPGLFVLVYCPVRRTGTCFKDDKYAVTLVFFCKIGGYAVQTWEKRRDEWKCKYGKCKYRSFEMCNGQQFFHG